MIGKAHRLPVYGPIDAGDPVLLRYVILDESEQPQDVTGADIVWQCRAFSGSSYDGQFGDLIVEKSDGHGAHVVTDQTNMVEVAVGAGDIPGNTRGRVYCELEISVPLGPTLTVKHLLTVSPSAINPPTQGP